MDVALRMKEMIEESVPLGVEIQDVGLVIGCHTGPGVLGVCFGQRDYN